MQRSHFTVSHMISCKNWCHISQTHNSMEMLMSHSTGHDVVQKPVLRLFTAKWCHVTVGTTPDSYLIPCKSQCHISQLRHTHLMPHFTLTADVHATFEILHDATQKSMPNLQWHDINVKMSWQKLKPHCTVTWHHVNVDDTFKTPYFHSYKMPRTSWHHIFMMTPKLTPKLI